MSRYMGTVRYTGTVTSPHPPADVWSYLADLRSLAEWDPSVKQIRLVSGEPGVSGTSYELEVGVLGRRLTLPYLTVAAKSPTTVVFTAESDGVQVRDEARIRPIIAGGSSVTWDAELRLRGARQILDPLIQLAFNRLGGRAEQGLRERLNEPVVPRVLEEIAA